ncbi:MAG: hypothetical protein PF481_09385 [Bacteroidales bacterium]|nr:hypothetical protein [Bacteroidales bacterium]
MNKQICSILVVSLALFMACDTPLDINEDDILARVDDEIFTRDDLRNSMPLYVTEKDSAFYAEKIVKTWVEKQLLYKKAKLNVPDNEDIIARQIEEYAKELYIHRYEELYVNQKLDTLISTREVSEYYTAQKKDFILREPAVKPLFIVFSKELDLSRVKQWFYSSNPTSLDDLKDFTYQFSSQFYFSDTWFYLSDFVKFVPGEQLHDNVVFSQTHKILQDSVYYYYIKIDTALKTGDFIPKELIYNDIATILLHKRQQKCVQKMKTQIYNDAVQKNQFEIYTK